MLDGLRRARDRPVAVERNGFVDVEALLLDTDPRAQEVGPLRILRIAAARCAARCVSPPATAASDRAAARR